MATSAMWMMMGSLLAAGAAPETRASETPNAASAEQLTKLQGTWRALKLQVGGRTVQVPGRSKKDPGVSLEIHGDHYEFRGLGADFKGRLRVDAGSKPKRIEMVRDDGLTTYDAYRLEGDSLKLIGVSADRSAKEVDKDVEVWTFDRVKP